jgi:hypothetical protein
METCPSPAQPRLASTLPRATNVNSITVNLPPAPPALACVEGVKAITLSPQPLKIAIETTTDWPVVLATFFVGISVATMTYMGQRTQVRAATANFRNGWQQELRQLIAKFIAVIARIHYELSANPDYLNSSESNPEYSQLIETHATIELMLDRSKPYAKEISKLTERLIDSVKTRKIDQLDPLSEDLLGVVNGVLEQTWKDIRNDLKGKT